MSSIALVVKQEGARVMGCSACERLTFRYDAELFCSACGWLVPDVNDRLAERYIANEGPFSLKPGECSVCGETGANFGYVFPVTCPGCGAGRQVSQHSLSTTADTVVQCACGYPITIPADVWCPGCHLNLRGLTKITELIKKANAPDRQIGENLKEPPLDRAARLAIGFATAGERRSRTLPEARQRQMLDGRHLDMLLFNDGQIADWILDHVKLRSFGHRLHRDGGMLLLREVTGRVAALDGSVLRQIEIVWDGIGD